MRSYTASTTNWWQRCDHIPHPLQTGGSGAIIYRIHYKLVAAVRSYTASTKLLSSCVLCAKLCETSCISVDRKFHVHLNYNWFLKSKCTPRIYLFWPRLPTHCRCRGLLLHPITHNDTYTLGRTALDERSDRRRDLYVHNRTFIRDKLHDPRGTRTGNPRKRAAADPRLRPHGHQDRMSMYLVW